VRVGLIMEDIHISIYIIIQDEINTIRKIFVIVFG
jgi:hypothetical protein